MTTVLIVRDRPAAGGALAEALRSRFDTVQTAGSPMEALDLAVQLRPDVVITSFPAATSNGESVTAILRRDPRTSACHIIAHSDWCWTGTRAKARELGCDAFVPAHAPLEELLEAIDRLMKCSPVEGTSDAVRTGLFD